MDIKTLMELVSGRGYTAMGNYGFGFAAVAKHFKGRERIRRNRSFYKPGCGKR